MDSVNRSFQPLDCPSFLLLNIISLIRDIRFEWAQFFKRIPGSNQTVIFCDDNPKKRHDADK